MRAATTFFLMCMTAAGTAAAQDAASSAQLLAHLTGTWTAPEERTPRGGTLDEQVFGAHAVNVRDVTLVITPSGDGDLQIRQSVVGSRGRVFVPSITEVKMRIGEPVRREFGQLRPAVTVTSAEERYLDGNHERFTHDGTSVSLAILDLTSKELNLQFDTPDGRGGLGATLTVRPSAGTDSRARRRPS